MKQSLILLAAIIFSLPAIAQETTKPVKKNRKEEKRERINAMIRAEEEGVIAYKKHFLFGIKLNTDGYGILFEKGYAKSIRKATLFQLAISERKHQKEIKQSSFLTPNSPFIYGKLNFFYPIKLGVQKQFLLGNKSNKNGVMISGNVGGGISLGLLRAYEVEIDDSTSSGRKSVRYDSPDSLKFVDALNRNPSGPGLFKGWSHLKMTPGLYAKTAVRFDYGRYNELVSAIEVGLEAEFYSKKIPQMLYNKEKQFFFSAFFALEFGKRK